MKTLICSIFIVLSFYSVRAQKNSAFVDSVLNLIINHKIPVLNKNFQKLNNDDIIFEQIDTITNCEWTRPKYIDNIYRESFDGILIKRDIIFDTLTHKKDSQYLEFIFREFDDNGNFKGNKIAFLIDRTIRPQVSKFKEKDIPTELITNQQEYWSNKKIQFANNKIELDSCHFLYRIQFHKDFTFSQYYFLNDTICFTKEMESNISTGVEADNFFNYKNKLQGHYITNATGFWTIENSHLILKTEKGKK